MSKWSFIEYQSKLNRDQFDCGVPVLNDYIKKLAGQDMRRWTGTTIVAASRKNPTDVAAYYSICTAQIAYENFPTEAAKEVSPYYPIPAARIARLAVDKDYQKSGLGKQLLMNALVRIVQAASLIAAHAIIVDAKNEKAKTFYKRYGFQELRSQAYTLFTPIETVKKALSLHAFGIEGSRRVR